MTHLTLPLRILLVGPRPVTLDSLPSRVKVEALYDALEDQGDRVIAEWLWPASIHGMGVRLSGQRPAIGVVYLDSIIARGEEGLGFCLETGEQEKHVVPADLLAALLTSHGVRLLILSPTKASGVETGDCESLVGDLAAVDGVNVVLFSEGLSPAGLGAAATALFTSLLAGDTLSGAISNVQSVIHDSRSHRSGTGSAEPAPTELARLFLSGADTSLVTATPESSSGVGKIVRFPGPGLAPAWRRLAVEPEPGGLPPELSHGFAGRALELAKLERAFRDDEPGGPVWVYGYEGLGKTSLLAHVARWLVRTGRHDQAVYTSFAGGGLPESALYDLGMRLVGEGFSLRDGDPASSVERALIETPTLIIWDNLESVLPDGEFAMSSPTLAELLELASRFARAGQSRLCLMSDTPVLPRAARGAGKMSLTLGLNRLSDQDALDLLDALVTEAASPPLAEVSELVSALGGHSLALCILSALMEERPPGEIIGELEGILPGLRTGDGRLGNEALNVALECLMRAFGEDSRLKLYPFGLFSVGFMEPLALRIVGLDEREWDGYKKRLASAELLHEEQLQSYNVPYVHLHPALSRYLDRRLSLQRRSTLESDYYGGSFGLLNWLLGTQARSPDAVRAFAHRDLPNLRRSLRLLLQARELNLAVGYTQRLGDLLRILGLEQECAVISDQFQEVVTELLPGQGPLSRPGVQFLLGQSERLSISGRAAEARAMLQQLVERMSKEDGLAYSGDEAAFDRGTALHRFGRSLLAAGRLDVALGAYGQALSLLGGIQRTNAVQRELLSLHEDMPDPLLASMQLDKAEEACNDGLEIARELQDRRAQGTLNVKLGTIAVAREDTNLAREHFGAALDHFREIADTVRMMAVWDQMGTLAWQGSDLAEAQRCYEEALRLAQEGEHPLHQGHTLVRLAQIAEKAGCPEESEARYEEAIAIYQERNAQPARAAAEMALGQLLFGEGRLQDARVHAEAARQVAEGLGTGAHPWQTYVLLQRISDAEGNAERVSHWRARAQEAFARSPDSQSVRLRWQPLIQAVARSCRGEALDMETVESVEKLEASEDWQQLAQTIWQILGGERGGELYAELDHVDALVVRGILEAIDSPETEEENQREAPEGEPESTT